MEQPDAIGNTARISARAANGLYNSSRARFTSSHVQNTFDLKVPDITILPDSADSADTGRGAAGAGGGLAPVARAESGWHFEGEWFAEPCVVERAAGNVDDARRRQRVFERVGSQGPNFHDGGWQGKEFRARAE